MMRDLQDSLGFFLPLISQLWESSLCHVSNVWRLNQWICWYHSRDPQVFLTWTHHRFCPCRLICVCVLFTASSWCLFHFFNVPTFAFPVKCSPPISKADLSGYYNFTHNEAGSSITWASTSNTQPFTQLISHLKTRPTSRVSKRWSKNIMNGYQIGALIIALLQMYSSLFCWLLRCSPLMSFMWIRADALGDTSHLHSALKLHKRHNKTFERSKYAKTKILPRLELPEDCSRGNRQRLCSSTGG